jgi:RNA polymerase sigma factor (sigma-70 family)
VAEGIISLIKAIELFDLNSPYLFSTYAGFWIKQKIQLFLNKNQLVSQGSADKEKKRVVFYDRQLISNQETKSYSLIDKLDDPDNSTAMREQFYKEENKNQINEIINSLEDSEAILIIRLYHRIMPRNLTDLYCLVSEAEKQVLREELKIKGEKISPWDLTKKKCQQSTIVKKYLKLFFDKYNLTELAKIIGKKESSVNRIKNNAFKKLQEKLKNAQQSSLKNSN